MKPPKEGSVEWFEAARRQCVDHIRALLSIQIAYSSVQALLREWKTENLIVAGALHAACVVAYARPFTPARTKNGKITYPTRALRATQDFDNQLHEHLLDLRHKLIAHSDYQLFPSTMYVQTIGNERHLNLGVNTKALLGIKSHSLACRYEKHLSVCAAFIEKDLNECCEHLAAQAALHPAEFNQTHNLPDVRAELTLGPTDAPLPRPSGPAGEVAEPSFPDGLSDYRYIQLTHEIPLLEGLLKTIASDGSPLEVRISTDRGKAK